MEFTINSDRFIEACRMGYMDEAKYYFNADKQQEAFNTSCFNGHLAIAQWLLKLQGINIHADDDEAFRESCFNGHLTIAKWLYELGGIDIHAEDDEAFRWSCIYDHLDVAQWLLGLGGINECIIKRLVYSYENAYEVPDRIEEWLQTLL